MNVVQAIAKQLGILPVKGKYHLYKRVNYKSPGVYASVYNPDHLYTLNSTYTGECDPNVKLYATTGLHASNCKEWHIYGDTTIAVEIDVEDVVSCVNKDVRCTKFKVVEEYHPLLFMIEEKR